MGNSRTSRLVSEVARVEAGESGMRTGWREGSEGWWRWKARGVVGGGEEVGVV